MGRLRDAIIVVCGVLVAAATAPVDASAQLRLPPARAPCSVLRGRPCHPAFCGIFHRGPCFPDYGAPFGENLQLTIVTTDRDEPAPKPDADHDNTDESGSDSAGGTATNGRTLGSIGEMFAALHACWVAPPRDQARAGMQYTVRVAFKRDGDMVGPAQMTYSSHDAPQNVRDLYRDAVSAALERCAPLHFSKDLAATVVGRPIPIRFVDDRTIDADNAKH